MGSDMAEDIKSRQAELSMKGTERTINNTVSVGLFSMKVSTIQVIGLTGSARAKAPSNPPTGCPTPGNGLTG